MRNINMITANNFKSLEVVGNSKVTDYLKLLNYMCFSEKKEDLCFLVEQ